VTIDIYPQASLPCENGTSEGENDRPMLNLDEEAKEVKAKSK